MPTIRLGVWRPGKVTRLVNWLRNRPTEPDRAWAFAQMALLIAMPEAHVRWLIEDRKIDAADYVVRVAAYFDVPQPVARYRLIQLGLLPEEE